MGNKVSKSKASKSKKRQTDDNKMSSQEERRQEELRECVRKKLLKFGQSEQLEESVLALSDCREMKETYFRSLLKEMDDAVAAVADEKKAHELGIRNLPQKQGCIRRLTNEFDNVQNVEVRLVLCQLNGALVQNLASTMHRFVKRFDYGPYHAALIIDDVVLEWNDSSLVIPRRNTEEDDWISERNVHHPWGGSTNSLRDLPVRAEADKTRQHFDIIVEEIKHITMEKLQLIDALAEVAVQYNTKHTYGLFSNNCQHFVRDCLHVLGITNMEEVFRLEDHKVILNKEGLKGSKCEEFNSHQTLDDYVKENLQNMNESELELCICHYLHFHTFQKASPKEAWRCQSHTCLQSHVEKRLQDFKPTELK